jgi:fumarate hydratase class II
MNAEEVLPPGAPWGAQTQRALRHFAVGDERMPWPLLQALVLLKACAAEANAGLGRLDAGVARAIVEAAEAVLAEGDAQAFPLSAWQSGSGTQSHMNVNEVLALRASRALGRAVHPNDEVNRGQSSNDVVPSALHVAAAHETLATLLPAGERLVATLADLSVRHADVIKLGRTHLQDAVPMTFGQEAGAWCAQIDAAVHGVRQALPVLWPLAVGGTAVGTGLNTHPRFAQVLCEVLQRRSGQPFRPADNRFAAIAGLDALVAFHATLKSLALALGKMAGDLRLLGAGPRGGVAEVVLPANEPGSSIMPGKVNPTQCEVLVMVAAQVVADDLAVTLAGAGGQLQLNAMRPLLAVNLFRSLRLLADAMASFEAHALRGLQVDAQRMAQWLQGSLMLVTALAPHLGYDRASRIAQHAHRTRTTLRESALADGVAPADFDRWVDPRTMLAPQ